MVKSKATILAIYFLLGAQIAYSRDQSQSQSQLSAESGSQFLAQSQPASPMPMAAAEGKSRQDADLQKRLSQVDAMVVERMAAQQIPGYCLAIIMDGRVVFQKPYGFASLENRMPVTPDTVFGLASLTKTFTALALLSLVDQGLVGLDDPLSKYLEGLTPPYRVLTIRQLASMTAGVQKKVSKEVIWKDQMDILLETPLAFQPGSEFLYSNFSYRLLGSVIEKVTRRPYLELVRELIFARLDMENTATTVLLQPSGRVAEAYGDNMGNGPLRPIEYKNPAVSFSAGMLASTSNDLIKYVLGLLSGKMLSAKGYETLWRFRPPLSTGQPSKWAFGWAAGANANFGGQFSVSMNGGTPGVASSIIIIPETNSAVIALSNLRKPPVYDIAKTAARMVFGGDGNQPALEEPLEGNSDSD